MGAVYATIDDLESLWCPLVGQERSTAEDVLALVSAEIRRRAAMVEKDFDAMLEGNEDLAAVAMSVCCDVTRRYMNDLAGDGPAMSQMSQAAGGYSVSGTFLTPGGGLFLKRSELSRLGLRRQRFGVIELA